MALKWILQSVRALLASFLRMVLFYFLFLTPGTVCTHALGRGSVWRCMKHLAIPPVPRVAQQSYSPLTPANFPPATPRTLPLRTALPCLPALPGAHTAQTAVISVSQGWWIQCCCYLSLLPRVADFSSVCVQPALLCWGSWQAVGEPGLSAARSPFHLSQFLRQINEVWLGKLYSLQCMQPMNICML